MNMRTFSRRYPRFTALICISIILLFAIYITFFIGRESSGVVYSSFDPLIGYDGTKFNVLVTGGAGFIGSHVVEFFENTPYCEKIVVVDNLRTGKRENLNGFTKVIFVEESIENVDLFEILLEIHSIRYIFHLAALISVSESMVIHDEYIRVNSVGTSNIMKLAEKSSTVKRIIFSSSAAVYGSHPSDPKFETDYPFCESYYAVNKLDGEFYARIVSQSSKKDEFLAISLRFFNVFGERQDPNSAYAAVIPNFIKRACVEKEKMSIYGDGEQTRDFVYVKDIVNALVYLAFNKKRDEEEVKTEIMTYNVGYEVSTTINSLADMIHQWCPLTDSSTTKRREDYIKYEDGRMGEVRHSRASSRKLRSEGWKPKYSFNESLRKTVDWFLENKK